MAKLELFGASSCPHTRDMREWLDFRGQEFVEYDVESDSDARRRLRAITAGQRTVPVLVEDGEVVQVGWLGRGCVIAGD